MTEESQSPEKALKLLEALKKLPDLRDNRGKRHDQVFVLYGCVLAIMVGLSTVSGIHRFLKNKWFWLQEITQKSIKNCISRAHLPRLLDRVDWESLNQIIFEHLEIHVTRGSAGEWIALDGKALRGSPGEQIVSARTHQSEVTVAQSRMQGLKSSEILVVRSLLESSALKGQKITLDALHCNPETTAQTHQNQGIYLIQVKENQPILRALCQQIALNEKPLGELESLEKSHGRLQSRDARFFSFSDYPLDSRWKDSGLLSFVRLDRKVEEIKTQHVSTEVSYYVTNQLLQTKGIQGESMAAIRQHWGIESWHWIRDVTLSEDKVKSKYTNQAQILGLLRTCVLGVFKKFGGKNMKENLDNSRDSEPFFMNILCQAGFL
jgi:predicted transposase YbfD/YdcC